MSSLRQQVKDLKIHARQKSQADFDPEDDIFSKQPTSGKDSDSDVSVNDESSRKHYEVVGKSKLRKPEKTRLDEKRYGGQAVSRDSIFQDDNDVDVLAPDDDEDEDPFAAGAVIGSESEDEDEGQDDQGDLLDGKDIDSEADEDEEIDSDEAFEEGEEDKFRGEGFVFRGSGKALEVLPTGSDDDEVNEIEDQSDDESGVSGENQSDVDMEDFDENTGDDEGGESEDEEELEARPRPSTLQPVGNTDRETLKALISNDTAALASSLSASLSADAKKGAAVKKQYQIFDRLLDARIKLQKGLTASNDLDLHGTIADEEAQAALRNAEEAAIKLYATIESLRQSIVESNTSAVPSKKRKRPTPSTTSSSTSDLWTRLTAFESQSLQTRQQTLDKWSAKTRSTGPITSSATKLNNSSSFQSQSKLSTILTTYLHSESSKLMATAQPSEHTYDDSNFYQSLLRDLINSRAASSNNGANTASLPLVPLKLHPSGNTARGRKVDTKASKGRKIRYTVHEKLENFMAGQGRGNVVGQWNEGAVREFFASLLGQRGMLGEEVEEGGNEMDVENGEDREVEALRLFRT